MFNILSNNCTTISSFLCQILIHPLDIYASTTAAGRVVCRGAIQAKAIINAHYTLVEPALGGASLPSVYTMAQYQEHHPLQQPSSVYMQKHREHLGGIGTANSSSTISIVNFSLHTHSKSYFNAGTAGL